MVVRDGFIAIGFDEKSFVSTILGFNHDWVYKSTNEFISQNIVKLSTTNKIHLKIDVTDGSVVDGIQEPILFTFVLDKPCSYKVFCEPDKYTLKN